MQVKLAKLIFFLLITNVIYSQREVVTPDPIDVHGYVGGENRGNGSNGGNGGNRGNGGKTTSRPSTTTTERQSVITVNGKTFTISAQTEASIYDFLAQHRNVSNLGSIVTTISAFFSMFDLFKINASTPELSAYSQMNDALAKELILKLSAPGIWNRMVRAKAAEFCEEMQRTAIITGKRADAEVWTRLRDVMANPERYKDGGIKFDKINNKIILRSLPAMEFRDLPGFDFDVKPVDKSNLITLYNYLMQYTKSRDYIFYVDYMINFTNPYSYTLNERDKLFLNYALLTLSDNNKKYLRNMFIQNCQDGNQTFQLWNSLREFLYEEKWRSWKVGDNNMDELGFYTDDLPEQSDIVTGEYPRQ
jgi:hypothetical protein